MHLKKYLSEKFSRPYFKLLHFDIYSACGAWSLHTQFILFGKEYELCKILRK